MMDGNILHSGSGDAIARDWELPELPSGTPSLGSTPSLPTSQELAEIFGTSDDEDEDFPFPLSVGGLDIGATPPDDDTLQPATQQNQNSESLFSSLVKMEEEAKDPLTLGPQSQESATPSAPAKEESVTTPPPPLRKSTRLTPTNVKTEDEEDVREKKMEDTVRKPKPTLTETRSLDKKPQTPDKVAQKESAGVAVKTKGVKEKEEEVPMEEKKEEETENEEDENEDDEESVSDDPDRLWCICRKPHNDRFMICCDICEEWFHGDCVGISVNQGRRMERAGKEYICPVCTERTKLEKEIKSADRMARQAKREEMREARHRSLTDKHSKDPQRRRSLSGSLSGVPKEGGDNYGIDLLFQPDNAPPKAPPSSDDSHGEGGAREERKRRSFYRALVRTDSPGVCIGPDCSGQTTPPSIYCSDACIENYAEETLKTLASRGVTFETDPSEFVRGSKGISMIDKATGKTVIGIQAPTDKTLVSWLKQHSSYQVLMPSGKRGRELSFHLRPKRLRVDGDKGQEGRRERESPGKQRSLNDPETVRMNAKKALFQTLWRRKEAVDDVSVTQEQVEKIANQIEVKLYNLHGNINTKYKTKYRSLLFNLKDSKNQGLFRKVCLGQISPSDLVRMRSEQYASDELAEWREKTLKKDLDKIVEIEEEARNSKKVIRKITCKGEVEIEAEKTEAIEMIAPPPEEEAATPSTPASTSSKPPVQSQDGANPSDNGATAGGKQDAPKSKFATAMKQEPPKAKSTKERPKAVKREPSTAKLDSKTAAASKEAEGEEKQGGGSLLDLLTDTTAEHGKHIYHPQCQVCLGKKSPPDNAETSRDEDSAQNSGVEDMQPDSLPPAIPLLWEGLVDMPGTIAFTSTAYPVSGSTEYITTLLPATLHVMGRIADVQVWDYIDKLRTSTTREIVVLRFDWTEEDRDGYESMLNYLVRKHRCGVVDEQLHGIKDFYLVPLMVDQPVPHQLLPFSGPGLPDDRPNLILGVVVQTKGIQPDVPPDFSLTSSQPSSLHSSSARSLKRHWSTGSDDPESTTSTTAVKKRRRRRQTVGFGGATPPLDDEDDDVSHTETENQGGEKLSFYSKSAVKKSTSAAKPPPTGIKSILSQLSDEKLKELASAMSNIEEATVPTAKSSELTTSTVTSPATGQMVTTTPFSVPTHSTPALGANNHSENAAKSGAQPISGPGSGDGSNRQQQARFHKPPYSSQLQRPPLHPQNSYGPPSGAQPPPQHHSQQFGPGAPSGYNSGWNSSNSQPQQPYQPQGYSGSGPPPMQPYHGGPPPNQYSAPPPHHGSPHQYPGSPTQQYSNPHPPGPPNPHGPPHQYPGDGPPVGGSSAYPPQNYQHGNRGYNDGGRGWHHDRPHPSQNYYDGGEARLNELESRDYGHRSQPHPQPNWRDRERERGRERDRHGWRHNYRDRR